MQEALLNLGGIHGIHEWEVASSLSSTLQACLTKANKSPVHKQGLASIEHLGCQLD